MMKKIYYAILIFSVALAASCSKNEPQGTDSSAVSGVPIEFSIEDATKALLDLEDGKTVTWQDGDVVGLFQAYGDNYGTWAETALNVPYRYSETTGKFHPVDKPALWAGTSEDKNKICVYYPYVEDCTDPNKVKYSLAKDQTYDAAASSWTMGNGYGFASVMVKDVEWGKPVALPVLNQANAILRLNITNNSDKTITIGKVETTVSGTKWLTASWFQYNITNSPVTGGSSNGTTYKSIVTTVENGQVGPGEAIDLRVVFRATDLSSTDLTVSVTSDQGVHPSITFKGGNIGKGASAVKRVSLEPVVEVTNEYEIGQMVEGGVLYYISDDRTDGMVLYPETVKKGWASEATFVLIANDETDGSKNVSKMKGSNETLENFPAAKYCDDLDGEWYLPARDELYAVFTGLGTSLLKSYGFVLGTDAENRIWTSTTSGTGTAAKWFVFSESTTNTSPYYDAASTKGTDSGKGVNNSEYYVRCVKKVDLTSAD